MSKSSRKELSLVDKIKVISDHEKLEKSYCASAETFGVGKTQIQLTIKRKEEYKAEYEENMGSSRKRLCTRLMSDDLEHSVWE